MNDYLKLRLLCSRCWHENSVATGTTPMVVILTILGISTKKEALRTQQHRPFLSLIFYKHDGFYYQAGAAGKEAGDHHTWLHREYHQALHSGGHAT